ncbi:hypothetical protein SK128_028241 [Halocaridina rubra]|uniref:Uncharacterized protein n=1 Tax=Halocaridina rubra TaxID=373956 RepID=A0AAN8ZXS4_HALRR
MKNLPDLIPDGYGYKPLGARAWETLVTRAITSSFKTTNTRTQIFLHPEMTLVVNSRRLLVGDIKSNPGNTLRILHSTQPHMPTQHTLPESSVRKPGLASGFP